MDWEQRYRLGETPWDKGAPAPPLMEWILTRGAMRGNILVPGCGLGHDARAIVKACPEARIVGLDVAASAIHQARQFALSGRESYQVANLFDLPAALTNHFEWVFEHTCFCAIQPQQRPDYVRGVVRALRPEGALLAIFFLNPWDPGEAPEEGGPPFPVTRRELDNLFSKHFDLVEEFRPQTAYPGREGREIIRLLRKRNR
jgi:methyl halide transferase